MNSLFSRFGLLAVLVALLLPVNAVAQQEHIVDGDVVVNIDMGELDSVRVIGNGNFLNGLPFMGARTIENIFVENGMGQNESGSDVTGTFRVTGARSQGINFGETAVAEVRSGGVFTNREGGIVGTFDLSEGNFSNWGRVTTGGTVSGGTFMNEVDGSVTTLVQNDGTVHNEGTITGVTLSNGRFENLQGGIVQGSLVMLGGTVDNAGLIADFVYGGAGTYNAIGDGSIGNFSLYAGRQFEVNNLAGIADTFGLDSIDLAGADLVWNLNGSLGDNLGFFGWDNIFGVDFTGGEQVALFTANWDGGYAIFNADNFGQTLTFGNYTIIASMDGVTVTPEPATLAMVGLGLVGLGWARRRRRK